MSDSKCVYECVRVLKSRVSVFYCIIMMRILYCYFRCEEGVFEYKLNVIFCFVLLAFNKCLHSNGLVAVVVVSVCIENVNITNIMECCA